LRREREDRKRNETGGDAERAAGGKSVEHVISVGAWMLYGLILVSAAGPR
jgi:hypothetical protein